MLDQKTFSLGDQEFTIQQLPTTKGIKVAVYLTKAMSGMSEGVGDSPEDVMSTKFNIGVMISGIIDKLDVEGTPQFIKSLILDSVVVPKMDSDLYEGMFSGDYQLLFDLLENIIDHNKYGDLLKKKTASIIKLFVGPTTAKPSTRSSKGRSKKG